MISFIVGALLVAGAALPRGAPPAGPTPWIEDWWQRQELPAPRPEIAPGEMLVGWPGYLEAHVPTAIVLTDDTPEGPLRVDATSTLKVDWGDGTVTGPYVTAGDPWPDGTIVHVYERRGAYTVVVTQTWTGTWTVGGEHGTLPPVTTSGRIDAFPAREVQAVIR